jgi:hypothetical protein
MLQQKSAHRTRRAALKSGLATLAAIGVAAIATRSEADTAKATPAAAAYQTKPNNGQACFKCSQFIPSNACKVVSGTISPNGWCKLYAAKNA